MSKQYLRDIKKNTLDYVEGNGFFRNPIETRLITELLPTLLAATAATASSDSKYSTEAQSTIHPMQTSSKQPS
jgi:hypothetical protein